MTQLGRPHAFDHEEAIRLYEVEHLSFAAIARRLSVSDRSIRDACYSAGVAKPGAPRKKVAKTSGPTSDLQLLERFRKLTTDDPPIRADGLCSVCRKPRRPEQSARYAKGCAELDAFCSSTCARAWHGTTLRPGQRKEMRSYVEK